ncbi:MAG: response regulator [Fibrobacter sp.]|nr:response regulator [Fibrobacter sp.]
MIGSGVHVLIIDDEISICVGVCNLLELNDFKTAYALSGWNGLEYLEKNPDVDIVLLDVNLGPGFNGLDVLKEIKLKQKYVQVIMFTSHDTLEIGLECMKKGALDFLSKPFNEKAFLKLTNLALERKHLEQIQDLYLEIVVHDLKNPLQIVSGSFEMLKYSIEQNKPDLQTRMFETGKIGIRQIETMINNILTISRFEKKTLIAENQQFSIREQVESSLQLFQSVKVEIDPAIPETIYADKDLFNRILTNLTSNALRFVSSGDFVRVAIKSQGEFVQVSVTNNGSFIPEDCKTEIFDKFISIRKNNNMIHGQNFGLGLTFSKMAVEAMGGKIWVESEENPPCTTFIFSIKNNPDSASEEFNLLQNC